MLGYWLFIYYCKAKTNLAMKYRYYTYGSSLILVLLTLFLVYLSSRQLLFENQLNKINDLVFFIVCGFSDCHNNNSK